MGDAPQAGTAVAVGNTVAVAFSGGRDSLALLHASCRAAHALGLQVVALHVHHGLLAEADDWLRNAQHLCKRWRRRGWPVRLRWAQLAGSPAPGDSTEAWARRGRHAALDRLAKEEGATLLLLAQHRRDQAETFLLQALRGGGPAGLSAMPTEADRDGLCWARPWLGQPRAAIDTYVRRHRLRPIEDPSNDDPRLARNRLRLQVWPALSAAFDDAETTLAAAAQRAQEAAAALAELAAIDLAQVVDGQGRLQVADWRRLSAARQANVLRAWWTAQAGRGAPQALVSRLLVEVPPRGAARWPAGNGVDCLLYRGQLQVVAHTARGAVASAPAGPGRAGGPHDAMLLDCSQPGRWPVPGWAGCIEVRLLDPAGGEPGLPPAALTAVRPGARVGGEQFQVRPRGLPRSLKKQFQAAGVPEHQRAAPLLWSADGALLFVPGLGPDARHWASAGQPALALRWCPDAALSAPIKPAG
jgi:tRNA(Ile)-lysidine synthase